MNDRIREFDIFLRVTEKASFSAAARSLDCDPSTISKIIQRLENRLSVRLFNRTSRALALTQDGMKLLEAAQRVVEALEEVEHAVGKGTVEVSGTLRVNTSLAFALYHVAPHVLEFSERHPELRLDFVLTATPVDMIENQIDVSLRSGYIPDSSLVAKRISATRWIVCASPAYLKRAGVPLKPDELKNHNCLNFLPGSYRSTWPMLDHGRMSNFDIKGTMGSNSPDLLRALACEGLGVVRLSEFHVGNDIASGHLVQVLKSYQPDVEEPVFAVYPSKRNLSLRLRCFLDFLDEKLNAPRAATQTAPPIGAGPRSADASNRLSTSAKH